MNQSVGVPSNLYKMQYDNSVDDNQAKPNRPKTDQQANNNNSNQVNNRCSMMV